MRIIFLGAPGVGKGTQAAILARERKLVHIATGDLFRQALEQGAGLGIKARSYMDRGKLVPDGITMQMVLGRMLALDCESGVILDGFPRNLKQAEMLDKALAQQDKAIDKVVHIKVTEEELVKRLNGRWICRNCRAVYHVINFPSRVWSKCDRCGGDLYQRPDDTPQVIRERLQVYFAQTTPLIDYYARVGKLLTVDGEGDVDEVSRIIVTALQGKVYS